MKEIFLWLIFLAFTKIIIAQEISYNQEIKINTNSQFGQNSANTSRIDENRIVVTWNSGGQVVAKIFDENLNIYMEEFLVNSPTIGYKGYASVTNLSNNTFVICWESEEQDGSERGIFGQLFYSDGTKKENEFQANTYTEKGQRNPKVASLSNGGFAICWQSDGQDGSRDGIFGQKFDNDANKIGNEFQVNTDYLGNQSMPSIIGLDNGQFVICWSDYSRGIFSQIFNNDATKAGYQIKVNSTYGSASGYVAITNYDNNRFIICWQNFDILERVTLIYAQIFTENGNKVREEILVSANNLYDPKLADLGDGIFAICWINYNDENESSVYLKIYQENDPIGRKSFKISKYSEWVSDPFISRISNNRFFVSWSEYENDDVGQELFGKYYFKEPLKHDLSKFEILNPYFDETIQLYNPTFIWEKSTTERLNLSWELTYDLFIDKSENFSNPLVITDIQDTIYQIDSLTPGQTYFWKVLSRNISGDSLWSSGVNGFYISSNAVSYVNEIEQMLPEQFKLSQNYPNPFNPTTTIEYSLPIRDYVSITIYDVLGNKVKEIVNEEKNAGNYQFQFDGSNISSGIYYYKISTSNFTEVKKMLLLK